MYAIVNAQVTVGHHQRRLCVTLIVYVERSEGVRTQVRSCSQCFISRLHFEPSLAAFAFTSDLSRARQTPVLLSSYLYKNASASFPTTSTSTSTTFSHALTTAFFLLLSNRILLAFIQPKQLLPSHSAFHLLHPNATTFSLATQTLCSIRSSLAPSQ